MIKNKVKAVRPKALKSTTILTPVGCGNMHVTLVEKEGKLFEIFLSLGKSGGCGKSQSEALGRLLSLALDYDVPITALIKRLSGIRCPEPRLGQGGTVLSCADGVAKVLKEYLELNSGVKQVIEMSVADHGSNNTCVECGSAIIFTEGCEKCPSCGWSKCA